MNNIKIISQKSLSWLGAIIAFVVMVWYNYSIYPWMLDDAFITFRYADNFASGYGLVYNLGERVEGYTTFLWTFILGLGGLLDLNIVVLSKILGALSAVGTLLLIIKLYLPPQGVNQISAIPGVMFLGTCGIYIPWISSGMEVNLFAMLIILTLFLYQKALESNNTLRYLAILGALLAMNVMTRPEGAIFVMVIFFDCLFRSIINRDLRILALIIPLIILYVPYFIWRVTYYGYLLPNTYYAKVGYSTAQIYRGFEYLSDMVTPALFLISFAVVGAVWNWRGSLKNGFYIMPSSAMIYFIYVVIVGGDCMPAFRFFAPLMPVVCLLAGIGITSIIKRPGYIIIITAFICGYNIIQMVNNEYIGKQINADKVVTRGKHIGLWLREHFPPETVIATNTAGSIPYYSGFYTIDMLGMNNEYIAHRNMPDFGTGPAGHEKGDGEYVLSRSPDLIQFGSSLGGDKPGYPTDQELYDNPRFHELYSLTSFYIPALNRNVLFYVKK